MPRTRNRTDIPQNIDEALSHVQEGQPPTTPPTSEEEVQAQRTTSPTQVNYAYVVEVRHRTSPYYPGLFGLYDKFEDAYSALEAYDPDDGYGEVFRGWKFVRDFDQDHPSGCVHVSDYELATGTPGWFATICKFEVR